MQLDEANENIFAFTRSLDGKTALVLLNLRDKEAEIELLPKKRGDSQNVSLVLSNYESAEDVYSIDSSSGLVKMSPYEGRIYAASGVDWE